MTRSADLVNEVVAIVAGIAEIDAGRVSQEARLQDLGLDSLDGLRIVAAVEKKYGIVIDETEIGKIREMPDIIRLVLRHAGEGG